MRSIRTFFNSDMAYGIWDTYAYNPNFSSNQIKPVVSVDNWIRLDYTPQLQRNKKTTTNSIELGFDESSRTILTGLSDDKKTDDRQKPFFLRWFLRISCIPPSVS